MDPHEWREARERMRRTFLEWLGEMKRVVDEHPDAVPKARTCSICGAEIPGDVLICRDCRQRIGPPPSAHDAANATRSPTDPDGGTDAL